MEIESRRPEQGSAIAAPVVALGTQPKRKLPGRPFVKGNQYGKKHGGKPAKATILRRDLEQMLLAAVDDYGGMEFFRKRLKPRELVPMLARMVKDRKDIDLHQTPTPEQAQAEDDTALAVAEAIRKRREAGA